MPGAKQWTRKTKWRQGSVLPQNAVRALGLVGDSVVDEVCAVVITHDCDLANDNLVAEPFVEVIPGRVIEKIEGNYAWGKSPRTLHYTIHRAGEDVFVELISTKKSTVQKEELAEYEPDSAVVLDGNQLNVLRNWLACRYSRAAFPDSFVERFKETKAEAKLAKKMERTGSPISFVYFKLDDGRVIERELGDPHELSVVLVYNPGGDPDSAADIANDAAEALEEILQGCFKDPGTIKLNSCMAISEDDITVSQSRKLIQWRLEYITLRSEDNQLGSPDF